MESLDYPVGSELRSQTRIERGLIASSIVETNSVATDSSEVSVPSRRLMPSMIKAAS
jgi:hypothetical protein